MLMEEEADKGTKVKRRPNLNDSQEQGDQEKDEKEHEEVSQERTGKNNVKERAEIEWENEESVERDTIGQAVPWKFGGMQKINRADRKLNKFKKKTLRLENAGQEVLDELWERSSI